MERHSIPGRSNGLFRLTPGVGPTSLPYSPKCRRKSSWFRRLSPSSFEAKACGYHSYFVPALKPSRGRPQGGLAVLSRVATPSVVPHSGVHYAKGRWMHVIVHRVRRIVP
eukprot:2672644-Amphidinium_carterae.1